MSDQVLLANHLDEHADAIIAIWRETIARNGDVPDAERLSDAEFIDHVPKILERVVDRLRGYGGATAVEGKKHGQHRWQQGYDIAEIVNEFSHLRTALTRATYEFARRHDWTSHDVEGVCEAIHDVIDEATADSVHQFQEDSRVETQAAMNQARERQAALEDAWIAARSEKLNLRNILANLPVAVWVVDAEGTVIGVNNEAERLHGIAQKELVGQTNVHRLGPEYGVLHPDGSACSQQELPIVRALRGETIRHEEWIWVAPGQRRPVSINASPLLDSAGRITGAVEAVEDITDRKELEESLADSEARFRTIAEKSPVMIWRVDASGALDYVNQTLCEFRGRTFEQEIDDPWPEGVHPDDLATCVARFRAAFASREPFESTYRFRRHDGQYRWINDRGTPYHDARGYFLGYLGSRVDITERIELEKALECQRELAEEASQHKTRLVSALSHDARTPLNAVVLAAQLLDAHLDGHSNPEVHECLRTIRHSVRNMLDLIGDLLDLSKIDAGVLPPELSRFPLEPVLTECLSCIETQARLKGLDVRVEPGALTGAILETDRAKLKQILNNLLSNALKFTERGHVRVFGERTADQIHLGVEDTGIGISSDDQARIFDEFATLSNPQRPRGEGTGLGLAICRRLTDLLGGEITLRSAPGQGSTFTVVLPPAVVVTQQALQPLGGSTTAAHATREDAAVLVAEDHDDSRQTLAKVLHRMGFRVLEADNGRAALDVAGRENLLAILMDVNMPIMDGIDATLALRADPRFHDLPIFALTGDVTLGNQHRISQAGFAGYLEKPVTWDMLQKALGSLGQPKLVDE
jgi:two-component system CheB/CheR fusion protein